jgi:hypothetical protein
VRKPKDKAIVERTIQIFQRWFFFKVRKRTFTSLTELNQCLKEYLIIFNAKIHRTFRRSREAMFAEEFDQLIKLPAVPFQVQTHHAAMLHPDCHLAFKKNYYSAPHQHRGKKLDIWGCTNTVEIYCDGERIAFHARRRGEGSISTIKEHYPEAAQAYWDASAKSMRSQAAKLGPNVSKLIHSLLSGPYPLQYLRRCMGIARLAERYPIDLVNKACELAMQFNRPHCRFIENLLKQPKLMSRDFNPEPVSRGENQFLRGEAYFLNNGVIND